MNPERNMCKVCKMPSLKSAQQTKAVIIATVVTTTAITALVPHDRSSLVTLLNVYAMPFCGRGDSICCQDTWPSTLAWFPLCCLVLGT